MEDTTPSETPLPPEPRADHLWIALRFFGLFMLLLAVEHLIHVVVNLLTIAATAVYLPEGGVGVDFQVQMLINGAVRLAIFAALGVYLLRDGRWVFRRLSALSSVSYRAV